MGSELIRINKADLRVIDKRSSSIENLNRKIQILRKRQLLTTLKEATEVRLSTLQKMKSWLDKLDKRIFSDESIAEMSLDKVISLFKYVGNLFTKTMGQMDEVERLMKDYLEAPTISDNVKQGGNFRESEERKMLQVEILKSFMGFMKNSADEAIVEQNKEKAKQEAELRKEEPEKKELDIPEIKLDDMKPD